MIDLSSVQPEKALSVMLVTVSGTTTSPEQAFPSISMPFTTTIGSFSLFPLSHGVSSNAPPPIFLTEEGIVTDTSFLQPLNAIEPMLVTLSGISIASSSLHPENAL